MTAPEFSRPLRVDPLPRDGVEQEIIANAEERAALAKLNDLPDIAALSARLRVSKWKRGVRVEGDVKARLTYACVVSLEPFEGEIDEPVDMKFLPVGAKAPPPELMGDSDDPDPLIDGQIDLGVIASEFFSLALDPYPRKPGVAFEPPAEPDEEDSPFQGLHVRSNREEPD